MTTRTAAALVMGCQHFDPQVHLAGVILNQVARPRHEAILRNSIEHYCQIPVLGAVPRLKCAVFPERHMGLVPPPEHRAAVRAVQTAQDLAERYLDLPGLWQVASQAPPLPEVSLPSDRSYYKLCNRLRHPELTKRYRRDESKWQSTAPINLSSFL